MTLAAVTGDAPSSVRLDPLGAIWLLAAKRQVREVDGLRRLAASTYGDDAKIIAQVDPRDDDLDAEHLGLERQLEVLLEQLPV